MTETTLEVLDEHGQALRHADQTPLTVRGSLAVARQGVAQQAGEPASDAPTHLLRVSAADTALRPWRQVRDGGGRVYRVLGVREVSGALDPGTLRWALAAAP